MSLTREEFGKLPDGRRVDLYTMDNKTLKVLISTLGGTIVELSAPDRQGCLDNLVLGYDRLEQYLKDRCHFGVLIGRYANRIGGARFVLDGVEYTLQRNEKGVNHLHGGNKGFDRMLWDCEVLARGDEPGLRLSLKSPHGDQGYPGNLEASVVYTLRGDALEISYSAVVDRSCPVNLTNHAYFNLAGAGSGDILGHQLMLNADAFTPCDEKLLPSGEIRPVAGTPLDFTRMRPVGERINLEYGQLLKAGGYDHNFVLRPKGKGPSLAARVYEPVSGRSLELLTTEPGVQFYSGNFMPDGLMGRHGKTYNHRGGFCLETQHYPDSPNRPEFPSAILRPGMKYTQLTTYRFSAD
jgi:aldose 1-epimerase